MDLLTDGKADALVRRKPSIECGGRGRPPCRGLNFHINHHFCNLLNNLSFRRMLPGFGETGLQFSTHPLLPHCGSTA
ncbi:MAG: hypothetical protein FJY65_00720 [Calditrichaeota bacterium]|nr:hypothetical protein [Calditrichota bacterium]